MRGHKQHDNSGMQEKKKLKDLGWAVMSWGRNDDKWDTEVREATMKLYE